MPKTAKVTDEATAPLETAIAGPEKAAGKPKAKTGTQVAKVAQTAPEASSGLISMIQMIERAARDPAVDVDKLDRLLQMQERARAQLAEQAFNEALAAAQMDMRPVAADSNNPQTKSKYASYAALYRAMQPIFGKYGFGVSFNTAAGAAEGYIRVVAQVSLGGHSRNYQIDIASDGKGAKGGDVMTKTHAVGAGVTYGQRYLLKMIFNIAVGADDDGNSASGKRSIEKDHFPGDYITSDQVTKLIDACKRVGCPTPKFLDWCRVATFEDISADKFDGCMAGLEAFGAKR